MTWDKFVASYGQLYMLWPDFNPFIIPIMEYKLLFVGLHNLSKQTILCFKKISYKDNRIIYK